MNNLDIVEYAKRTTDLNNPIQKKLVQAFTESMLKSTSIVAMKKKGESLTKFNLDEGNRFIYLSALNDDTSIFQDSDVLFIIAYSKKKKDETLLELISKKFFTGFTINFRSLDFSLDNFVTTDDGHQNLAYDNIYEFGYDENENWFERKNIEGYQSVVITDIEGYTDSESGTPIYAYFNLYVKNVEHKNELISDDVYSPQLFSEMQKNMTYAKTLIHITKPARIDICFLNVPIIYMGADDYADNTGFCYGIDLDENPFNSLDFISKFQNPTNETLSVMRSDGVNQIYLRDGELVSDFTQIDERDDCFLLKRLFYVRIPQSTESEITNDSIWGNVTIEDYVSGETINITGEINSAEVQNTTNIYYSWFIFRIPKEN